MSRTPSQVVAKMLIAAASLAAAPLPAAVKYFSWDGDPGAAEAWVTGGSNWGTATGTWSGSGWSTWDDAVFEGTAGLVNASSVSANTLSFNVDGYTLAGSVTFGNPSANNLTVASGATATIIANLTAAYATGLRKAGAGTAVLSGANSISSGALEVANGVLVISGGTTTSSAGLSVSRNSFQTNDAVLSTLRVTGGTLNVTGGSFFTGRSTNGGVNASLASLIEQTGGSITYSGTGLNIADGGGVSRLDLSGGTFTSTTGGMSLGVRAGSTLNISGTAVVTLPTLGYFYSDAVTGTGRTSTVNLNGGTLVVGNITNNSTANTANLVLNGGLLRARSASTINSNLSSITVGSGGARFDTNGFDVTVGRALAQASGSTGGLTKSGAGTLTLQGVNTYTGAVDVQAGTLLLTAATSGNASGLGSGGSTNTVTVGSGATLRFATNNRTAGYHAANVFINGGTITFDTSDNSFASGRTLTFDQSAGTLNGTGQWRMRDTNVKVAVTAAASGSVISVASLTLTTGNGNHTFEIADGSQANDLLISGNIGSHFGSERITKTGAGTLALTGSNTISGGITLSAGTLAFGANGLGASGTVTVGATSTLRWLSGSDVDLSSRLSLSNGVTATLDTGDNTVTLASAFGASSTAGLIKAGSGTLVLGAANGYSGSTTVSAGTLRLGNASALGSASSAVTVASGATLDLGGLTSYARAVSLSGSLVSSLGAASHSGTVTLASAATAGGAGNLDLTGTLVGSAQLTKVGAGTLTISGNVTGFSGSTVVAAGRLVAAANLGGVSVADGAILSGTAALGAVTVSSGGIVDPGLGGAGTLTASSLTLGATSGDLAFLRFSVDAAGGVANSLSLGNLVVNGGSESVRVDFGASLALLAKTDVTPYTLLTFAGTGPSDLGLFKLVGTQGGRQTASLKLESGALTLDVDNAFPIWSGAQGSGWSTAGNWLLSTDGSPTDFLANDSVVLNDSAATGTLELSAPVALNSLTHAAATLAYTLQSAGGHGVTSGSLIKTGSGSLTLATANDFTGGVTSTAGTLVLSAAGALGSGAVNLTDTTLVTSGSGTTGTGAITATRGVLRLGADSALGSAALTLSGTTVESDGSAARSLANPVTLAGNLTLGSVGRAGALTLGSTLNLGGVARTVTTVADATVVGAVSNGSLAKDGAGTLVLSGANTFAGGLTVSAGKVVIGGSLASDASVSGTLEFANASALTHAAALSGAGTLAKSGAGRLTLTGTNTMTGKVRVTGGSLAIGSAARLGSVSGADALTLDGGALVLTAGTTLGGSLGITLGSGGGLIDSTAGALVVNGQISGSGSLTLAGNGNTSATGGGDGGLGLRLANASGTFTGEVRVTAGLVSYVADGSFGAAGNRIVLDGGGLLETGANLTLARELHVASGGGLFRTYGGATATVSGALTGSGTLRRTDGGNLILSGDLSGFAGTITHDVSLTTTLSGASAGLGASAILNLNNGALVFSSGRLGSGTVRMAGGTLRWASGNTDDVSGRLLLLASSTANLDTNSNNVAFAAGLGSVASAALNKSGSGRLTLAGGSTSLDALSVTGGALEVAGASLSTSGYLSVQNAGLTVSSGILTTSRFLTSDGSGANSSITVSGGTLVVTGTNNSDSTSASFLVGHWPSPTTFALSGGEIRSLGALLTLGWDGQVTFNHSGGTANLLGIRLGPSRNNAAAYNLTGGRLNLGASGIVSTAGAKTLSLGQATVGALADWSSSQGIALTSAAGTTFDTLDASDGLTARTITLNGTLSGSGKLVKDGAGTLVLGVANAFTGGVLVQAGTLRIANTGALGSGNVTLAGGVLDLNFLSVANTLLFSGGTVVNAPASGFEVTLSGEVSASDVNALAASEISVGAGVTLDLQGVTKNLVLTGAANLSNLGAYAGTLAVGPGASLDLSSAGNRPSASAILELRQGGTLAFGSASPFTGTVAYKGGAVSGSAFQGTLAVSQAGVALSDANLPVGTVAVGSGGSVNLADFSGALRLTGSGSVAAGLSTFAGTLELASGGSLDLSSADAPLASVTVAAGGVLGGTGSVGSLSVASGGLLAPGNSPGLVTAGTSQLAAGGSMEIEVLSVGAAIAGVDYDSVDVTGLLDLSALGPSQRFLITLVSLSDADTPGDLQSFNPEAGFTLDLFTYGSVDYTGSITSLFTLDTAGFTYFGESIAGSFVLVDNQAASAIQLVYAPIPEPSTYGLALGGLALALAARRRRRRP